MHSRIYEQRYDDDSILLELAPEWIKGEWIGGKVEESKLDDPV